MMKSDSLSNYIARLPDGPLAGQPLYRDSVDQVAGQFYACHLSSVFQPIEQIGDAHSGVPAKVLGHAAYVRCRNGENLSPWNLFSQAADDGELVSLDRLARTVHAINYFVRADESWRLFLSVDARLVEGVPSEHGKTFERVLRSFGVSTPRIVIMLPEALNNRPALLAAALVNYRLRGYRVAVRLRVQGDTEPLLQVFANIHPDIVMLRGANRVEFARYVHVVKSFGAIALASHMETQAEIAAATHAGADWRHGYVVGFPGAIAAPASSGALEPRDNGTADESPCTSTPSRVALPRRVRPEDEPPPEPKGQFTPGEWEGADALSSWSTSWEPRWFW
jgi:EAL domain-containing protein (putative c-di-GMP-specific phosphodiesterase class I)